MTSRLQYILLFLLHFLVLTILLYLVFDDDKIYFLASELGLIVLAVIAFKVYQNIFQPLDFIKQGSEALLDEDFSVRFTRKGTKDMDVLVDVYNKMLDKIRNERTYQQEQHFFLDSLLAMLPVGILILDYDGKIAQFNDHAKRILDLSTDEIGQTLSAKNKLRRSLTQMQKHESKILKVGSIDYYRCYCQQFIHRGFPRKYFIVENISSEILATEKQAYGKVIRMMSHEVNNSIGAINSILNSLLSDEINSDEIQEYLPIVIDRNDNLAQFMKNFAEVIRLPKPTRTDIDLVRSIQNITTLYRNIANEKGIQIILNLPEKHTIHADIRQIEQFLLNVIKNSVEAIDHNGNITIQLKAQKLSIIDDGCGIPDEVKDQLFSPFFSTKPTGQGVGLTLVKQILFQHNYSFQLYTHKEKTFFDVTLT